LVAARVEEVIRLYSAGRSVEDDRLPHNVGKNDFIAANELDDVFRGSDTGLVIIELGGLISYRSLDDLYV
jgi:hypothetical protein